MLPTRAWTPILLVALSCALLTPALAGTAASPEIEDGQGDVDPLAVTGLKPEDIEAISSNLTMYDIVAAYVTGESRTTFHLALQVVDLDGDVRSPDPSVPAPTLPAWGTYDLHFRTTGGAFVARAQLDLYTTGAPPVPPTPPSVPPSGPPPLPAVPYVNFSLHRDDGELGEETYLSPLAGYALTAAHTIWFAIPKELVGEPADGTPLDRFWGATGHKGAPLDRAPDLALAGGGGLPSIDPADPAVPATYGDTYLFGQYPLGAVQSLSLTAQGPTEGTTAPGEALSFYFRIENKGTQTEEVLFMARAPRGWAATFDEPTIDLGPGSSRVLGVSLVPGDEASKTGAFLVKATSIATGQTHEIAYIVSLQGGQGTQGGGTGPDGAPTQELGRSDDKDSPPAAVGLVVALIVAAGAWLRRRRQ